MRNYPAYYTGLQTSLKKHLQYYEGLMAQVEITAADLKLSDRVLNQFRNVLKNK